MTRAPVPLRNVTWADGTAFTLHSLRPSAILTWLIAAKVDANTKTKEN